MTEGGGRRGEGEVEGLERHPLRVKLSVEIVARICSPSYPPKLQVIT